MYFVIHKSQVSGPFETLDEASKYADGLTNHLTVFDRVSVVQQILVLNGVHEVIEEDEPE